MADKVPTLTTIVLCIIGLVVIFIQGWREGRPTPSEPTVSQRCAFEGCLAAASVEMVGNFSATTRLVCPRCAEEAEAAGWAVRA